jgi:hypothetical protein
MRTSATCLHSKHNIRRLLSCGITRSHISDEGRLSLLLECHSIESSRGTHSALLLALRKGLSDGLHDVCLDN